MIKHDHDSMTKRFGDFFFRVHCEVSEKRMHQMITRFQRRQGHRCEWLDADGKPLKIVRGK